MERIAERVAEICGVEEKEVFSKGRQQNKVKARSLLCYWTWKGDGDNLVFLNKEGRHLHRHTLNRTVITPALKKMRATHISTKDTRASYITNTLDQNERMSFIQKQVGHTTTRMIVDHYYRHVPAPDDGDRLEGAWNSTTFLPPLKDADFQVSEKTG